MSALSDKPAGHIPFQPTDTSPFTRLRLLLGLVLLVFFTTVGLALLSHQIMKKHMLEQQLTSTTDLLSTVVSSSIDPWVTTRLRYMDTLSSDPQLHKAALSGDFSPLLLERWQSLLDFTDDVFFVYFGDRFGNVTMLPDDEPLPDDFDMFTRPWYLKAMETPGQLGWTDLYHEIITGTPQISAVVAVFSTQSPEPLGVMAIDVSLSQLQAILANVELPQGAELALFGSDQSLIASSSGESQYHQLLKSFDILAHKSGYVSPSSGDLVFISSAPIPETGWNLVLFTPRYSFYSTITPLRDIGVALGIIVLTLSLSILVRFLRSLSRKTRKLALYFQEAASSHFEPRRVMHDNDEFALLNHQFNQVILERTRTQKALDESQRRLSALMSNLPGMAYRCAFNPDWTMEFVSEGCLELTGYSSEDLIGNQCVSFNELICPEEREPIWQKWQSALASKGIFQHEYRITTCSKEVKWIWEQGRGVYDANGNAIALEGFLTDVTRRKNADQLLREFNEQLSHRVDEEVRQREEQQAITIQQAKMAELGAMVGAIAHQWNQPLSTISVVTQGIADLYEHNELEPQELESSIGIILQQIAFMAQTIEDFRRFFVPSRQTVDFEVHACVNQVMSLLKLRLMSHHVQFNVEGQATTIGFPSEFKQVLLNLVNNACDAFREKQIASPRLAVNIDQQDDCALIRITDNAGGIPQELLPEKLFEAFVSSKGSNGSGIGLWMSRLIIEKMHGTIHADNAEDGACFTILLPRSEPCPENPQDLSI